MGFVYFCFGKPGGSFYFGFVILKAAYSIGKAKAKPLYFIKVQGQSPPTMAAIMAITNAIAIT